MDAPSALISKCDLIKSFRRSGRKNRGHHISSLIRASLEGSLRNKGGEALPMVFNGG